MNKPVTAAHVPGRGRIYNSITETIGDTPLVRLDKFAKEKGIVANLLAKLEFFNPIASVKDRIGVSMIEALEAQGKIAPGKNTLIEPTSGNTGIALAFAAAAKGYKLILTMPETMSVERRKMLALLGAELVLTEGPKGMKGAIAKADELAATIPGAVIPQQFENPANPEIHRKTTAEEIWNDTQGVDRHLRRRHRHRRHHHRRRPGASRSASRRCMSSPSSRRRRRCCRAASPARTRSRASARVSRQRSSTPPIYDEIVKVSNDDSIANARLVARLEGVPVGISSGAALQAAIVVGSRPENAGKNLVVIIPSFAERYLSTVLFEGLGG